MSVQSVDLTRDEEAEKQRLAARQAATDKAWEDWYKVVNRAQRDYEKAIKQAMATLQVVVDQGRAVFLVAINKAWKDYREAK